MNKYQCVCQEEGQERCVAHVKKLNRFWKCDEDHYEDEQD